MIKNIRPYKNIKPIFGKKVYVDDAAIIIGNVTLGDDVSVNYLVEVTKD